MGRLLRWLRGVLGVGLTWATLWALFGVTVGYIILALDPASIDPGEEPIRMAAILGTVGLISGAFFAGIMSFTEQRKSVKNLSLWRAALWGALGGAALPLLTTMNDQVLFNTVPLGALSATLTIALARRAARRERPDAVEPLAQV